MTVSVSVFLLCALFASGSALNFISLGDWGAVNSRQAAVAKQMDRHASKSNVSFVLALGDNFYNNGVSSDTDPQWQHTYSNVYNQKSLQVPWYAVLGNHDYHQNPDAQIDFTTNKRDQRWNMPAHYYSESFQGNGFSIQILFIDTIWFSPKDSGLSNKVQDQAAKFKAQLSWLESALGASEATYLLVAGHYPIFSVGGHGDCTTLGNAIRSLLEQHKVDAYLCGHDHSLQHLQNHGVAYYLSGGGALGGNLLNRTKASEVRFAKVVNGFMLHEADATAMHTTVIDYNGNQIYNHVIHAKRLNSGVMM